MKLTKHGKVYWVDFVPPDGKRRRLSTRKTVEAEAYEAAGRIVQSAMVAPSTAAIDNRLDLSAALDTCWMLHWQRQRQGTIMRRVVTGLMREFAGVKVQDVSTKSLRAKCELWLSKGTAPATVNRRMSAIGTCLTRLHEDDPQLYTRPKMPHYAENNIKERYVTLMEEQAIFAELDKRDAAHRAMYGEPGKWCFMRNLTTFLLDTGFRFSEAFKFTIVDGHADLAHGTTKAAGTRTADGRRVPLTSRAMVAAEYLLTAPERAMLEGLDLSSKKPWDWCSHLFGVVTLAAGCPDVTMHILRHTCASRLVQRGVPIYTVSKWLGHSSVKVTERYAKLAPDSLAMALSALEQPEVSPQEAAEVSSGSTTSQFLAPSSQPSRTQHAH
ncbi:MAG TPA: site-specific integrase [Steroidobacteraceae bacterium]|jgi:integrase